MKYFSDVTNKVYDSVEELEKAETEVLEQEKIKEEKLKIRGERAKEVENAYKVANEKREEADELLSEFVKDYGSFHTTVKEVPKKDYFGSYLNNLLDLFNNW